MKNKLLEARLSLNLSQDDIATKTNTSVIIINGIETGRYKLPNYISDRWHNICKAYNMNISEFLNNVELNNLYRQNNDEEFINELKNKPHIRKSTDIKANILPKNNTVKKLAKRLLEKSIELGFYNTADRTAYNKYCKENNVNITVEEWHIIKKKLESEFLAEHGVTQSQYKLIQSLTKCAREVGFGDDYKKYNRWKNYKKTHKNPMPIEEWSKLDDIKQANIIKNKKSQIEIYKNSESKRNYHTKKAKQLGFIDVKQYYRWIDYNNQIKNPKISIDEWKKLDQVNMDRLNDLRNKQAAINI